MSGAAATTDEAILVTPDQVSWSDSPVISNAKGALLVGDPSKAEVVGQRVKLPQADFMHEGRAIAIGTGSRVNLSRYRGSRR
jgi:hypothetical protein